MSKDNNKKAPKVRFPGFTDDWEERKLSEVVNSVDTGKSKFDKEGSSGEYPILGSTSVIGYDDEYDYEGDFILTARVGANAGSLYRYAGKVKISDNTVFIQTSQNIEFLYQLLVRFDIKKLSFGTGQPLVKASELKSLELMMPTDIREQMRIGTYFSNLDHLITLHQRKLEKLKEYKKGMLQKMFPKNGENVPEVRFPGFDGEWEERKVSELCSISTGKSNTQDKVEDGEYPFYVRSPIIERSTKYLYDEEAVLTVGDGVGTGKVFHYVNGKYDLHQRCYRMYDFSDELNAHYFYHTFSKLFYKRVMAMTAKTSVDSVRLEMISDMKIPVPDIEEQRKIGSFLDNLDYLIALQQKKIESLKEFKKGCLQQMFV